MYILLDIKPVPLEEKKKEKKKFVYMVASKIVEECCRGRNLPVKID